MVQSTQDSNLKGLLTDQRRLIADLRADPDQLLLEQYKLFVEMADRTSTRRLEMNKFYISLFTGIIGILSVIAGIQVPWATARLVFILAGALGTCACILWMVNLNAFRRLNSAKFQVIHQMEKRLPFACYETEWDILGAGKGFSAYTRLTRIELAVPVVVALVYLSVLVYAITQQ